MCADTTASAPIDHVARLLQDFTAIANPAAFAMAQDLSACVDELIHVLDIDTPEHLHLAARLSSLSLVGLPVESVEKLNNGQPISQSDSDYLLHSAAIAAEMLARYPAFQHVAHIIQYQNKGFDGSGTPWDTVKGEDLPYASRILKMANALVCQPGPLAITLDRFEVLDRDYVQYDPTLLKKLKSYTQQKAKASNDPPRNHQLVKISNLKCGDVLQQDLFGPDGKLWLACDTEITEPIRKHVQTRRQENRYDDDIPVLRLNDETVDKNSEDAA